jgi:OFA family oxalate/formate antiporter-like MFS transporter
MASWEARLAQALPFYYGWVIFAVSVGVAYSARPLMAVATLSVFVVPMTDQFGWSRGLFSGVVSLGGLCAVAISPLVGRLIDRYGSGATVAAASAVSGLCAVGLSVISQAWAFYALYVPGRMVFASPLELGTSTAVSNWFIRRRPLALVLLSVNQGAGLALMPLAAQFIIGGWGWRTAWASLGVYTLAIGVLPALFLMTRRPEDMGLEADPARQKNKPPAQSHASGVNQLAGPASAAREVNEANYEVMYTVRQALRTRAFWVLSVFSAAGFMVQAGVSLHQVAHFINQGLPGPAAALTASVFAFSQVLGGVLWSILARQVPLRFLLSLAGFTVAIGAVGTGASASLSGGIPAATALGVGVGGLHLLLRLTWADYYGRQYLGSIRGLTLPVQIGGQALGPVIAGFMFDATGGYQFPFLVFTVAVSLAGLMVLAATPPVRRQEELAR